MSNDNFPFMGVIETTLKGGIPCRIARISFSGELAYEAYVPSDYAPAMMDLLWAEAQKHDGCLYGLEALGAMRIEKGHVTGAELDGRVSIDDAGLGKMANADKPISARRCAIVLNCCARIARAWSASSRRYQPDLQCRQYSVRREQGFRHGRRLDNRGDAFAGHGSLDRARLYRRWPRGLAGQDRGRG